MPSYAQLEREPWWGREIVTQEIRWLQNVLCEATGRPASAFGCKGDNAPGHMRGGHRSQEWIKNSAYCTNRVYTVEGGLTALQERFVPAVDFTPGDGQSMIEQSRRLYDAMRAGRLDEAVEFYGNINGDQVVDGWDNIRDADIRSDSSHLWHWHLRFRRASAADLNVMRRTAAAVLGEDLEIDMPWCKVGDTGENVLELQLRLIDLGLHIGPGDADAAVNPEQWADSQYGSWTARALASVTNDSGAYFGPWQNRMVKAAERKRDQETGVVLPVTATFTIPAVEVTAVLNP